MEQRHLWVGFQRRSNAGIVTLHPWALGIRGHAQQSPVEKTNLDLITLQSVYAAGELMSTDLDCEYFKTAIKRARTGGRALGRS
jgi:hypothetical protein